MTARIPLTDFPAQIAHCNVVRIASGLPALDPDEATKEAILEWNRLMEEARTRLREIAGRDLAGNWFTHQIVSREAAPLFRTYLADLATSSDCDPERP